MEIIKGDEYCVVVQERATPRANFKINIFYVVCHMILVIFLNIIFLKYYSYMHNLEKTFSVTYKKKHLARK